MRNYKKYFFYFLVTMSGISLMLFVMCYNQPEPRFDSVKKVSIALFHASPNSTTNAIVKAFQTELAKDPYLLCSYTIYNHGSDAMALRTYLDDAILKGFDLIFTIGHLTSIVVADATKKRGCRTPVVFAAVQDPVQLGIVPKDRDHTCFITGSSSETFDKHEQGFPLLLLLKPDIKRFLIPYIPQSDPVTQRNIIDTEACMLRYGIPVQKIETFSARECLAKMKEVVQEDDVIWVPRNPTIMSVTRNIATLASERNAFVYASSFGSIAQGATFSFSAEDEGSGTNAGKKAREILVDGKHPSEVPITPAPYNPHLWINREALRSKKLKIDPRILFLIENSGIAEGYATS